MYTSDGRIVCTTCFNKVPMSAQSLAAPWRRFAIIGGVAGAIPFFGHVSSSSSSMVNGQVTSFVYRDWIAVGCGVVAALFAILTLVAAKKERLQKGLAFAAGVGVLVLGGIQIARGFGVFETPESSNATSSTEIAPVHQPIEPTTWPSLVALGNS